MVTALHCATVKMRYELVEELLKQGAQPNANDGRTTLHYVTAASGCMPGGSDAGHPTAVVLLGFGAVQKRRTIMVNVQIIDAACGWKL